MVDGNNCPLFFVFHAKLAFVSSLPNHCFAKNQQDLSIGVSGEGVKVEQSGHVEVKGKRGCFALVHTCTYLQK